MNKREIINRNIGLTFDFVRELIDNPKVINQKTKVINQFDFLTLEGFN